MMIKDEKYNKKQQTVGTVHTHTHTHTDTLFNRRKIGVAVVCLIAIVLGCTLIFANKNRIMRNPMLVGMGLQNRIGEGGELENSNAFFSTSNVGNASQVDTSNWDLNRVNIVYDTEGVPVPVPKGFTASGADGEHTVNTGFVIYEGDGEVNNDNAWDESCNRNQFVWVPVYDPSRVYEEIGTSGKKKAKLWNFTENGRVLIENEDTITRREPGILLRYVTKQDFTRYGMQGYTREKLYQELLTSFDRDMESIERYGGFYIGRYETGNITSEQPVVQRMNTTISNETWYAMYSKMKNISTNENVETSMIWGCLWDETLEWIVDTNNKTYKEITTNATNWGNYSGSEFMYMSTGGTMKSKSYYQSIPTGSTERNKVCNIYDLAGNVGDWTLESSKAYGNSRCERGGSYGTNTSVAWRR